MDTISTAMNRSTTAVRAYRIGHARYLRWCLDELADEENRLPLVAAVTQRMLELSFAYIGEVSEQNVLDEEAELNPWFAENTGRAGRIAVLLSQENVDIHSAECILGYRLRQHHLALVLWIPEVTAIDEGLTRLDRLTATVASELGCSGRPLFVPHDAAGWAWLPLGSRGTIAMDHLESVVEDNDTSARIAVGDPAAGVDGFRSSHRRAVGARTVALAAQPGRRITRADEVGPVALMCHDMPATHSWIRGVLGGLITDDEAHLRLRETLRVFLATGGGYAETAELLTIHKNTVQYRLRKAEKSLGHRIRENRFDLELALRACHHLGAAVLDKPTG